MKAGGMAQVKFATQLDSQVAEDLRRFAAETDRSISGVVSAAVAEYLAKYQVRPAFRVALDEVVGDHAEVLARLAR
jgi:predicted transcriptional regulator